MIRQWFAWQSHFADMHSIYIYIYVRAYSVHFHNASVKKSNVWTTNFLVKDVGKKFKVAILTRKLFAWQSNFDDMHIKHIRVQGTFSSYKREQNRMFGQWIIWSKALRKNFKVAILDRKWFAWQSHTADLVSGSMRFASMDCCWQKFWIAPIEKLPKCMIFHLDVFQSLLLRPKGLARIWTAIAGFRVQSANRYTTRPDIWQSRISLGGQHQLIS